MNDETLQFIFGNRLILFIVLWWASQFVLAAWYILLTSLGWKEKQVPQPQVNDLPEDDLPDEMDQEPLGIGWRDLKHPPTLASMLVILFLFWPMAIMGIASAFRAKRTD
jgi:hypothetical protein